MKTTFKKIRSFSPCEPGWKKLIGYYNSEDYSEEVKISEIIDSNGVKDAIWALRAVDDKKKIMIFCSDVAESVLHIYEKHNSENNAVRECIEAVRLFAVDKVSKSELIEKRSAAAAAYAAYAADAAAAAAAAYAAYAADAAAAAADTAYAADAAAAAAYAAYAADAAAYAAYTAADAAYAADAAAAKWIEIAELLRKYCVK